MSQYPNFTKVAKSEHAAIAISKSPGIQDVKHTGI